MNSSSEQAPLAQTTTAGLRCIIAGASGLVGSALLAQLLRDSQVAQVHILVRRPLAVEHPKLRQHQVDFAALPVSLITALSPADEVYLALGTTRKQAGSRAAFRAVDYSATVACAQIAHRAGVQHCAVVTAIGSHPHSPGFYSRVKGQTELALQDIGFRSLYIARPSILDGDRQALGQAHRTAEDLGLRFMRGLGALIPLAYRPIRGDVIAHALVASLHRAQPGVHILPSGQMQLLNAKTC